MTVKHKWRICPLGEHWRKAHPKIRTRGVRGHCVKNRTKRDQIYSDEILEVSEKYFSKLSGSLSSNSLRFSQRKKFDNLILGWCKYWNDILKGETPLDPSLNIMAGIRWMFHKKNLIGRKLKRDISWLEALMYYKGYKKLEGHYRELINEKK